MALKKIQYDVRLLSTEKMLQGKVPVVYTNDLNSAEFVFNILDMTPEQLVGATATTMLYMRDGSFFQNSDVNLNGNTFTYLLKENEGNHAGLAQIQLVVIVPGTPEQNYPTQLYNFEVVTGLETKVATEVIIQDWTTLTADAKVYLEQMAEKHARADADHTRAESDHTRAESDHTRAEADHTRAEEDHVLFADMQITHDLDTGKNYKTNLEIYNGQPRLKLEEIV